MGATYKKHIKELQWQRQLPFFLQVLAPVKLFLDVSLAVTLVNASYSLEPLSFQAFVLPAQVLLLNVSISNPVVSLQLSGTLPAHAVVVPCAVAVYALRWVGGSNLITSNAAPIKSANSFWMSLKLMLHLFRFDPEQQRLLETKEHHRFAEKLCLDKAFKKDQHFDSSIGELRHGKKWLVSGYTD